MDAHSRVPVRDTALAADNVPVMATFVKDAAADTLRN
jgi:hypothetical protein